MSGFGSPLIFQKGSKDYRVAEVFKDDYTGATSERPAMRAMLAYLKKQKSAHVVIIDDISRLARDVEAHSQLRRAIRAVGGLLVSPSIEFKEDSDGGSWRMFSPAQPSIFETKTLSKL